MRIAGPLNFAKAFSAKARIWFSTLGMVWAPLLALAFFTVAITVPSQAHELYLVMIQDDSAARITFTLLLLCAFSFLVSLVGHALIRTLSPKEPPVGAVARALPDICGALVLIAAGFGAYAAAGSVSAISVTQAVAARSASLSRISLLVKQNLLQAAHLRSAAWILFAIGALLLFVGVRYARLNLARNLAGVVSNHWLGVWLFGAVSYCLLSILFTLSNQAASSLGTFGVVCAFAALLAILLSGVTVGSRRLGIPIGWLLLLVAMLFSALGRNDNHLVPETPLQTPRHIADFAGPQLPFEAWLAARQDLAHYSAMGRPYPVFIVAARGGGIYAASQEALFLSRMQDQCPNFSEHVFAISGVSGGGMGAALYSSLARQFARNQPWEPCDFKAQPTGVIESHAKSFLEYDILAPIVAAALFPDLLQRFLPIAIGATDRGKAMAQGLEHAWHNTQPGTENPFLEGFLNQWNHQSALPALLLNTTEVGNGRRFVISPFAIIPSRPPGESQTEWFYQTRETFPQSGERPKPVTRDLSLSAAAGAGARFPWILPAAAIERDGKTVRLVDGGYHDNSGIETALNVIAVLRAIRPQHFEYPQYAPSRFGYDLHLVIISGSEIDSAIEPGETWQGLDDLLSPIRALFSARDSVSHISYSHGWESMHAGCSAGAKCGDTLTTAALLEDEDLPSALGFRLSRKSLELIQEEVGQADECCEIRGSYAQQTVESKDATITRGQRRLVEYAHSNSYAACEIKLWLQGTEQTPAEFKSEPCTRPPDQQKSE